MYWVVELSKKHGINYKYYPQQSLAKSRNGVDKILPLTIALSIQGMTGSISKVVYEYKPHVSSTLDSRHLIELFLQCC